MLAKKDIKDLFDSFRSMNILVIGDVMIDSYLWGKVERISPEAPVPIVAVNKREDRLGGAANVALNIQSLGANPIICSVIGNDQKADTFIELLKNQNLSDEGIIKSKNRITTIKSRFIGNNVQLLRVDEEVDDNISKEEIDILFFRIKELLETKKINAIIFEDYDKGVIQAELIEKVVTLAKSLNIFVTVDPKKRCFSEYKNISLFKPNLKEIREGLKIDIDSANQEQIKNAVKILHNKQNIDLILLTLASEGVFVSERINEKVDRKQAALNSDLNSELIPAHKRNIADVSGAGDTVISVATLCLSAGLTAGEIAKISNLAGGLVCEQLGVVPIDKNILMNAILSDF